MRIIHDHLGANAKIVENQKLEYALVKVQGGYEHKLAAVRKNCAAPTRPSNSVLECPADRARTDSANELIKWHGRESEPTGSHHLKTNFIVPTSNICEPYFSLAGLAINSSRKGRSLYSFVEQTFPHINQALCDILDSTPCCSKVHPTIVL